MIPFDTTILGRGITDIDIALTRMNDTAAKDLAGAFSQMSPWIHYPFSPDELTRYFTKKEEDAPRYVVRRADNKNTVIGALGLRENWLRGPYIQFLGLTEAFQNRSVGEALLGHIAETAQHDGAQNLWVMASQFNKRALVFYQRHGFNPVATIDALVTDDKSEVLLRKRLLKSQ